MVRHDNVVDELIMLLLNVLFFLPQKKNGYDHGKRRINSRTSMAQRDEVIRRTVYVSDIDRLVGLIFWFWFSAF